MTYTLTSAGIEVDGVSYPLTRPPEFDAWLKTKQDAFIAGVLHVYRGSASAPPPPPPPNEEILL